MPKPKRLDLPYGFTVRIWPDSGQARVEIEPQFMIARRDLGRFDPALADAIQNELLCQAVEILETMRKGNYLGGYIQEEGENGAWVKVDEAEAA